MASPPHPVPPNDKERVEALASYRVLDTPRELAYDELCDLASSICECPVAYIGLIDTERAWLKASCGIPPEMNEAPRSIVVCSHTICQSGVLEVPDLSQDERFRETPLVKGDPRFRYYCGAPLINPQGFALGTICISDFQPRHMEPRRKQALSTLAHQVAGQLELRKSFLSLSTTLADLKRTQGAVEAERKRADDLLVNVLPAPVAAELKRTGRVEPRYHPGTTLLFTDFQGFTRLAQGLEPGRLLQMLDEHFSAFDAIADRHRLERLKTIGDAYMCVGGAPEANRSHAVDACLAALAMQAYVARQNRRLVQAGLDPWPMRLGVHSGPIMAGVVGRRRLSYDVWGDAVNVAARLEAAGEPGRVNVSEATFAQVERFFDGQPRGSVEVKHLGPVPMIYLDRLKPAFSADPEGTTPNEAALAAFRTL